MDSVVAEIKKRREEAETQNAIYVNKIKFEDVLRQIEKEGETVNNSSNLIPSLYKQKPTYFTSIFNYFY